MKGEDQNFLITIGGRQSKALGRYKCGRKIVTSIWEETKAEMRRPLP
jgi:hypothetical protein